MKVPDINTINKHFVTNTSFELLMQKRINKVLLICSNYDAFMLEEDGRIDEQIFNEYVSLNLRHPPYIIQATNITEAFKLLEEEQFELIITMLNIGKGSAFTLAKRIKSEYKHIPIVVLTHFSKEVSLQLEKEDLSAIDYVFSWLGNTEILLAIIKLIEDRMNAHHDVNDVGVQSILLVEDSIRFYSAYLPNIYKIIFSQSEKFMTEGANAHQQMIKMRGRPKILLATNYEDAINIYNEYKDNMLGVISDISYKKGGVKDPNAGFELYDYVKSKDKTIPFLLQSSDFNNSIKAKKIGADFIYKNTSNLNYELKKYLVKSLAFGSFIFKSPITEAEICQAKNLREFQHCIAKVPYNVIEHYAKRNSFSRWLNARALFSIAKILKPITRDDFNTTQELRDFIISVIKSYRVSKGKGIIAKFNKDNFDEYFVFSRIGNGSIGGKARGLAFIDNIIKKHSLVNKYNNTIFSIPRTIVVSTDIFDEFMEVNNLYNIAFNNKYSDEELLEYFINSKLPKSLSQDIEAFIQMTNKPLAIRSSSMLEDSHYQPFAGVYSTYMVPHLTDGDTFLKLVQNAIKSVYASVYFKSSKAYMKTTANSIDEEKMGIIIQEVCGERHEQVYFPTLSGVARSVNFYPIEPEKFKEGVVNIAMGLGKTIVDGGTSLRFSPKHPKKIIQFSSATETLRNSQKEFYALTCKSDYKPSVDEGVNLEKINFRTVKDKNILKNVSSTFDYNDNVIKHSTIHKGKKIITFNYVLNGKEFPLPKMLSDLLRISQKEMNNPVEIEFACNLSSDGSPNIFNVLQIRPIVATIDYERINLKDIDLNKSILYSNKALGNGKIENIKHIVYVKPNNFDASKSTMLVELIDKINTEFIKKNANYTLIGPGRWGSSDPWLGIPVKWAQISNAGLIIESGLENFRVDPSQGTHFFQNLTSFRVGYFTINNYLNDGNINYNFLDEREAYYEDEYIKIIEFDENLEIYIDGKHNIGVINCPNKEEEPDNPMYLEE